MALDFAYAGLAVAVAACYLVAVRRRRFARVRDMEKRFGHLMATDEDDGGGVEKMTYVEATEIMQVGLLWDEPWMTRQSLELALFSTYAVPTISALLEHTGQLSGRATVSRRGEDTGLLLSEIQVSGLDSERGSLALARTNWLHARHGAKITRDDMLFTLCLFIYEPLRMCGAHEWRPPTPLERRARFVFWREVGARMGIAGVPETSAELEKWRDAFVAKRMVFAPSNAVVARASLDLFLRPYARFLWPLLEPVLLVAIVDPVREAFGWPRPPSVLFPLVHALLRARALFIKHLCLPRSSPGDHGLLKPENVSLDAEGRKVYHRTGWFFDPLYVRPTLANSLWALVGHERPGAARFKPEGFTQETVGPEELSRQGLDKVRAEAARMRDEAQAGRCPFAGRI